VYFRLKKIDKFSKARFGTIITSRGKINTPIFMPVGTYCTVKSLQKKNLYSDIDSNIILSNTYHIFLNPGIDVIKKSGGIHEFMGWNNLILTDSGGYQLFSLKKILTINNNGVIFNSHVNGLRYVFTPENVITIQRSLNSDIIMPLDECTPYPCNYEYTKNSVTRTHKWLKRSISHFNKTLSYKNYNKSLFPIVQGGTYINLRKHSSEFVSNLNMDGNAIGGVCKPNTCLYEIVELVCGILPVNKPRYLMGVGTPANILECIALGVDMFDCVMPTRNARNGTLFTSNGIINIKNKKWKTDNSFIDENINCNSSHYHTKSYLHHLFLSNEILGLQIASLHNLSFYSWLIKSSRYHILRGNFLDWKNDILKLIMNKV